MLTPPLVNRREMIMAESRVNSVDFLKEELDRSSPRCPDCGSFLDAPRINPESGKLERKCLACQEWLPVIHVREARNARLELL